MRKKELLRIVEAMLGKEKEEHERRKKEAEHVLILWMVCDYIFREKLIGEKKEVEESKKRQEKELEEELRRRVETEEMLGKEKEEHEVTRKEAENVRALFTQSMKYNKYISRKNDELRDSMKRQAKELEEIKKEREEALNQPVDKELEKLRKEKKEAYSALESFTELYLEEVKRRVRMDEELSEKDTSSSACSNKIILLLEDFVKSHPPSYFICPITQDVMADPCVAADGFSYEAGAFKKWLDRGHITSPMTNLRLAHKRLVPNRTLRSAIQEWLQRRT